MVIIPVTLAQTQTRQDKNILKKQTRHNSLHCFHKIHRISTAFSPSDFESYSENCLVQTTWGKAAVCGITIPFGILYTVHT